MSNIAVVTDSTAYLTKDEIEDLGVYVVPLTVSFGSETYREEADISTEDFFDRVDLAEGLPTSSQPAVGEFIQVYEKLSETYDAIISIHISSKISGTFQTVQSIARSIEDIEVYPVDSKLTCEAQAVLIREAVQMINEGAEVEEILECLDFMIERTEGYFAVEDLTNLVKGGRVSKTAGNLAGLLKIKPILMFNDGEILLHEKIRTKKKALKRIEKILQEVERKVDYPLKASIVHASSEEEGLKLKKHFEKEFPNIEFDFGYFGPVIGVHVGRGALGVTWTSDLERIEN